MARGVTRSMACNYSNLLNWHDLCEYDWMCSQSRCATRLRYAPNPFGASILHCVLSVTFIVIFGRHCHRPVRYDFRLQHPEPSGIVAL